MITGNPPSDSLTCGLYPRARSGKVGQQPLPECVAAWAIPTPLS